MARHPANTLNTDYFVIRCTTPAGPINLAVLGMAKLNPGVNMIFYVGNPPKKVKGLDEFEMKIVAAVPNTVRNNVNYFTSQEIAEDKLLDEISQRFRGNIFASGRNSKSLILSIDETTKPDKIISQITKAIMQIAESEKVAPPAQQQGKRRKFRRSTSSRRSAIKSVRRTFGIPPQFELRAY
jgi:hypothetical protein